MSDERPWKLQLVCCGRDDGVVTCETRADAELTRSAYISAEGHDRQAILTGPPGAVETDPVALLGEYLGALGKGDWSETVCADMRALLEQVRTARNAATARAEQAEAALAEMREANSGHPRCCTCGKNLGYRNVGNQLFCWPCADGESPEARTALERAAGELIRCRPECSEMHTYEAGSCEAAVEQGDGEGGGA